MIQQGRSTVKKRKKSYMYILFHVSIYQVKTEQTGKRDTNSRIFFECLRRTQWECADEKTERSYSMPFSVTYLDIRNLQK